VLFRITQEALTNIAKHANATQATIILAMNPTQVAVTIEDNGAGFAAEAMLNGERQVTSGWGLLGIRERTRLLGGLCTIQSRPGEGSRIHVQIPLEEKSNVEDTTLVG
jgi:signal transduction histidine kinase